MSRYTKQIFVARLHSLAKSVSFHVTDEAGGHRVLDDLSQKDQD